MTESRRLAYLAEKVEHLKSLKRNTKLSHFDLVQSTHFLRVWIGACHLGEIVVNVRKLLEYVVLLGPLWDFLKGHDLEIRDSQERWELVHDYIHYRMILG